MNEDSPITDGYLAQSKFYQGKPNDEKDVENRIAQLQFLEQYLDENNIIRIYSPKDGPQNNSLIECDYIIESRLPGSITTVYIFLKYREGIGSSCAIISFVVKKNVTYGGQKLYWHQMNEFLFKRHLSKIGFLTDKYNKVIGKRAPSKKGGYTP